MNDQEGKAAPDASGTTQEQARRELADLLVNWFAGSMKSMAIALGRDEAELAEIVYRNAEVDDDLILKVRALKQEREQNREKLAEKLDEDGL